MKRADAGLDYCLGPLKRGFDLAASSVALLALAPLLLLLALLLWLVDGPPVLFVQERVGRDGATFRLFKYRTMRRGAAGGLPITARGDARVTTFGCILRAAKLDELPQLLNVLKGEMSIVGPRPEIPAYVARYGEAHRGVLRVRPGLTDPASLRYRNEEALLGAIEEGLRESYYVQEILPKKLELNLAYITQAGLWRDVTLVARTLVAVVFPGRP